MVLAADVVTAALAIGVVVLCVTTAVSALALPSPWRRRRRTVPAYPIRERRVITGPPATVPERLALPPVPRQDAGRTDGPEPDLREAESLVAHLLDHDPERLAELLAHWINADDDRGSPST